MIVDLTELQTLQEKRKKSQSKLSLSDARRKKRISSQETVIHELEQIDETKYTSQKPLDNNSFIHQIMGPLKSKKILAVFLVFLVAIIGLWPQEEEKDSKSHLQNYITLKKVGKSKNSLTKQQADNFVKKGLNEYLKGSVPSYIKAQALLAHAIEGQNRNTQAMAMLCMVYLELWPFTQRDIKSQNTISHLVHRISALNKISLETGLCRTVDLIIKGHYHKAKTEVDSALKSMSNFSDIKTLMFYYLKAQVSYYLGQHQLMLSYLEIIQKNLPKWIAPYILSANVLMKEKKLSSALSMYKKIISLNNKHKLAKIQVALIEYKHFNVIEKSESALKIALAYPDMVSHKTLAEAYFGLAQISLKKNDKTSALKNARLAYSYNPAHSESRNMIVKLGGVKKLKQTRVRSSQLIYEGDQMVLDRKFTEAIAYYKEAFNLDEKKNAMVAIKLAKSYWALNFFNQAIKWLKTATNIDPKIASAYVLMAEYYSQRFDFYNAEKVLKVAFRKTPINHELYRGRAYLSFQKGNYPNAIRYSKKALKIYSADLKSYVILAKAHTELGNMQEAMGFSTQAVEIDENSIPAQLSHANAIAKFHGDDSYFLNLVNQYPLTKEYRLAWVKHLFNDEQYSKAQHLAMQLLEIEPKYSQAYFYLGQIFMAKEEFSAAYEAFLQASILNPSDPAPTFYVGKLRIKQKQYSEAEKQFKKVLALNKLYPKAYYYLGKIAFLQQKYDETIKWAELESQSNPRLVLPYLLAGSAYEEKKEFLHCSGKYQKAVELSPDNMNLYVKTARCYRKSGHLDLALKILKKASGEDESEKTGDPQLYKELGVIYEIKGAYREAEVSYCNYLNLLPSAEDRSKIETRMQNMAKMTGRTAKNCG